jgi:hypothetical protein
MRPAKATAIAAVFLLAAASTRAGATVPICEALTLYGDAAAAGVCTSLSPAIQNLWVCELAGEPDIHSTFNLDTAFHITVRSAECEGYALLDGTWPNGLVFAAGASSTVCDVDLTNYVQSLNAVPQLPAAPGQTLLKAGFIAAIGEGRLTPSIAQGYIDKGVWLGCP